MQKIIDGRVIDLTPEEVAERLAEEAAWEAGTEARRIAEIDERRRQIFMATTPFAYETATATKQRLAAIEAANPY